MFVIFGLVVSASNAKGHGFESAPHTVSLFFSHEKSLRCAALGTGCTLTSVPWVDSAFHPLW